MARQICAFCGESNKRSGEHIWSDWIGRLLPSGIYDFKRVDRHGKVAQWTLPGLDAKTNVPCKPCNGGWMSRLEDTVKPILREPIATGCPVLFPAEKVPAIAAFAFKSAVVFDHQNVPDEPFFSAAIRKNFMDRLSIPAGVQVWIASYSGGALRGNSEGYRFVTNIQNISGSEFYSFTYVISYFVIQVLAARWRDEPRRREYLPVLAPDPIWMPAVNRLWPNFGRPVVWPPEQDLSEDSLNKFCDRWKAPIVYQSN